MGVNYASCARRVFGMIGLTASFGTSAALAQSIKLESGTEREKQQLQATGIRAGAFEIRPQFGANVVATDNVYYEDKNRRADASIDARAMVSFKSLFARHELRAELWANQTVSAKYSSENLTQYGGQLGGRIDVTRSTLFDVTFGYDRFAETRYSLNSNRLADTHATYTKPHVAALLTQKFNNITIVLTGRAAAYSYADVLSSGIRASQKERNFKIYEGGIDLIYGVRDPTRFVVHAAIDHRAYDIHIGSPLFDPVKQIDRTASSMRVEVGVQREITDLIQGTIRFGYMRNTYDDPRIKDFNAFSYHGDIVWNVTPLTSLVATADRRLDQTVSPNSTGNLRDEFAVAVQHELRRNVVLFSDVRYARVKLLGTAIRSSEFDIGFGARYFVGDNFVIRGDVRHSQRLSGITSIDYRTNLVTLGVKYLF